MRIDLSSLDNSEFDRGAPRWREALWWISRSLFFAPWFPIPSFWKVCLLRIFGAKVGQGVIIRSRVNIAFPWRFSCGDNVWIGDEVCVLSLAPVTIGSNTCVSQRAYLCTGSHEYAQVSFDLITAPINIGESCWLGAQCFVGAGVRFGDGSRCLAGAVVVKDVDSDQTVAGVPAKPV